MLRVSASAIMHDASVHVRSSAAELTACALAVMLKFAWRVPIPDVRPNVHPRQSPRLRCKVSIIFRMPTFAKPVDRL